MSGIRINQASGALPAPGTVPTVFGVLRTVDGERVIDEAEVTNGDAAAIPRPLVMNCRATSEGLSPQGLLVWMSGRATVATPEQSWFAINDGSPLPIRVELHGLSAPPDGRQVTVTGVLGADPTGPVLRMNATDLMTVLP
jgi:hypothetical protein